MNDFLISPLEAVADLAGLALPIPLPPPPVEVDASLWVEKAGPDTLAVELHLSGKLGKE